MHEYFRDVKSIKLLKINCDKNDFSWTTYASTIPSLLFIPAHSSAKTIESHSYDNSATQLTEENLLKFILFNSKNPATILDFIKANFINPKALSGELLSNTDKNKLNNILTELVSTKLKDLTLNSNFLNAKITSIYHSIENNNGTGPPNDIGYLNNVKTSLTNKLDKYLYEIDFLKQLKELFV